MKNNRTTRFFILFLVMQTVAIAAMLVASWQVVILSHKIMQRDNIRTVKTLAESYAITVKSISDNYEQSREVIPGIRDALAEINETLHDITKIKIKVGGLKIKPLAKSSAIKKSQEALNKTITVLNSYEKETQPAMVKSLQKTEKTLQRLNEQLSEEQSGIQYLPWYIAGILLSLVIVLIINSLFLIFIYKQQPAKG